MDKVAVRKAVGVQYPVTGAPILVTGGGGRGRGAVGVTRGQRALGALGMLAGAAGALTGQHRSLGGLVQSAISGGAQGSALGRGIGRGLTTRTGQARADLREQRRLDRATERAAELEQPYQEGRNLGSLAMLENDDSGKVRRFVGRAAAGAMNPGAYNRRRAFERQEALRRANEANVGVRQQAQQNVEDAAQMRREGARFRQARAAARGGEFGAEDARYARVGRNVGDMMGGMDLGEMERRSAEAMAARGSGNVGVADFTPTNARGEEVVVQPPQLPPPPGSVASGDQSADPVGNTVTTATGFNMQTENEPGDVVVRPSRPTEEEEDDDPMRPSAMSQEAMRTRMARQNRSVAVEDRGRQATMEEFGFG